MIEIRAVQRAGRAAEDGGTEVVADRDPAVAGRFAGTARSR